MEWNAGQVILGTFTLLCIILVIFVWRAAFGWLDARLDLMRGDAEIKFASADKLRAEIAAVAPPQPETTSLPADETTPRLSEWERNVYDWAMGELIGAGATYAEIVEDMMLAGREGGNRKPALAAVRDYATRRGMRVNGQRQMVHRTWGVQQLQDALVVTDKRGTRRIARD